MIRKLASAALVSLLALASAPAFAYRYDTCNGSKKVWESSTKTFTPAILSFQPGSTWRSAFEAAVAGWNSTTPGTRFRFLLNYQDYSTFSNGDGVNNVAFTSSINFNGALAITHTRYQACIILLSDGSITEADVEFNPDLSTVNPPGFWQTSTNPDPLTTGNGGGPAYSLALVALHELGHAFGLKHEDSKLATMNAFYPDGGPLGPDNDPHPHADDSLGDRAGYGTGSTERDLAASAFEWYASGSSRPIPPPAIAYRGHSTPFRFTISNRGTITESSVRVQYYLSTDRNITTSDIPVGAATFSLGSGVESTLTANVVVPISVTPGNYFFGYIVDPLSSILEKDETNNRVAHTRTTSVPSVSPPVACISGSTTSGPAPLTVSFDASCSSDPDGSITSYAWTFGDGATGSGVSVSHTYFQTGSYTVRLVVTDNSGLTDDTLDFILVTCSSPDGAIICPAE